MQTMKNLFNSLLCVALLSTLAIRAEAQLVRYEFKGTLISGTPGIGNTISGSITLDTGAEPNLIVNFGRGQSKYWYDGNFAINGITDSGISAGTSYGPQTLFYSQDDPAARPNYTYISNYFVTEIDARFIKLFTIDSTTSDGISELPNPWNPLTFAGSGIDIWNYEIASDHRVGGSFRINSFTQLAPATIIIDGWDTGVQDLTYQGESVAQRIAILAYSAENHGEFVSRVTALANDLRKSGVLSITDRQAILNCAAKSIIGKN